MALKYRLDSVDMLDAAIKSLYKQSGDAWVLDVDGVESAEDVQGLKNALSSKKAEVDALKKQIGRYGGKTPEDVNAILDELESAKAGGKIDIKSLPESEREELVRDLLDVKTRKFSREIDDLKKQLADEQKARGDAESKYVNTMLEALVMKMLPGKVVDTAIPDAVEIAKAKLKYDPEDGKFRAEDGSDAEKWIQAQIDARPHWQKPSHGSGARGGSSGSVSEPAGKWIDDVFPKK